MRALVVFCHPSPESFNAAIRDRVVAALREAGAQVRLRDLYAEGFQPILTRAEWEHHVDATHNAAKVADDLDHLRWCNALVFVYPTWWYAPPAMLKGWLERVMVAGVAFHMPSETDANIRPGLTHIRALGIFTTCGANRWLSWLIGHPGRKILMRGLRVICAKPTRTMYVAQYDMNHATPATRARHLERVASAAKRFARLA